MARRNISRSSSDIQRSDLLCSLTQIYGSRRHQTDLPSSVVQFKIHLPDTLPYFATHSVSFSSLTMTPTTYLLRLTRLFISLGGHLHQHHLSSLSSLSSLDFLPSPPSAVVLCIGLGARSLIGLEDEKPVYPVRGQVVVLEAPWIKTGWTRQEGSLSGGEGGQRTYVIPRGNGEVVIGGTRDADDS
jgi:D-amino-acid oxidase